MTITWAVDFDWDGDDSYAYGEEARVTALRIERGRAGEFDFFEAGKLTLTLENNDRRFDPWYALSPLDGLIMPGRRVRVVAAYGGVDYPLFLGKIEDIEPTGSIGQRQVLVTAYDGLRDLVAVDVPATLQAGIRTDEALTRILDAVGWPAGQRNLDVGNDTLAYWWTPGGENAKQNCDNLARSEYGGFFVTKTGSVRFLNRINYNTAAAILALDQADIADVLLRQPWEQIYNVVTVRCNPLAFGSLGPLWTLQDFEVYLEPGESKEIWAEYANAAGLPCAGKNVVTPIATTDYTAHTVVGGGGTNMTASLSVAVAIYSSWAKLTVTNNHPTISCYITLLQIRGEAITPTPTPIRREITTSQATYGKRALTLDVPWQQNVAVATDLATILVNFYAEPKPPAQLALDNLLPNILQYELCDRLNLTIAAYSIDIVMRVQGLCLYTGRTMQDVKVDLSLGPADDTTYWLVGVVDTSELGVTTRLGY